MVTGLPEEGYVGDWHTFPHVTPRQVWERLCPMSRVLPA
jgi:hypothetical protein